MVDGIPFNEFNALLELHPTVFKSVDVKYSLFIHGNSAFAGIVNFKTANKDLAGLNLPGNSRLIKYQFGEKSSGYVSFMQDSQNKSPRVSRLLMYDFSLPLEYDKMLIQSNDITGKYDVSLFGFDAGGNWINVKKSFHTVIK